MSALAIIGIAVGGIGIIVAFALLQALRMKHRARRQAQAQRYREWKEDLERRGGEVYEGRNVTITKYPDGMEVWIG